MSASPWARDDLVLPGTEMGGRDGLSPAGPWVAGEDDEGLPAARVAAVGATADPVKDYLKQIGRVRLLSAGQEVELAKRIEAGLFAGQKLADGSQDLSVEARTDLEQVT